MPKMMYWWDHRTLNESVRLITREWVMPQSSTCSTGLLWSLPRSCPQCQQQRAIFFAYGRRILSQATVSAGSVAAHLNYCSLCNDENWWSNMICIPITIYIYIYMRRGGRKPASEQMLRRRFFLCALCSVCCIWELCTTEINFSLLARFTTATNPVVAAWRLIPERLHGESSKPCCFKVVGDSFTQRRFYTQKILHTDTQTLLHTKIFTQRRCNTDPFTHRLFSTQTSLHRNAFTHRPFYTETLLHTDTFAHRPWHAHTCFSHRPFYAQTLLHTNTFTHRPFYTQTYLDRDAFTHRPFYTNTRSFTQTLLHTDTFTHRRFYTQTLLHTEAFSHRPFYTQTS